MKMIHRRTGSGQQVPSPAGTSGIKPLSRNNSFVLPPSGFASSGAMAAAAFIPPPPLPMSCNNAHSNMFQAPAIIPAPYCFADDVQNNSLFHQASSTRVGNGGDSPNHSYQKPMAPLKPPAPQQQCLTNFLNDVFAQQQVSGQQAQYQQQGLNSSSNSSLAASTSIFSVNSCASLASTAFTQNPLLNGFNGNGSTLGTEPQAQQPSYAHASPDRSQWYHGKMDRKQAEALLVQYALASSYLIRESDRKPGSYVLSFFGRTGINHFRITAICGDYYCGGKQFVSLEELVGYYTVASDLLKNERLVTPLPPPEPVSLESKVVVAILPYSKMPDTDELSFRKGDIFVVHNEMSSKWLWCTNLRNQESGLVFTDLVEQVADDCDPNEVHGWFHSRISKEEALEKLARSGPGSFLVRPSDNSPGDYSIFFHVANSVQRFRVERKSDDCYVMGGRVFPSLESVIARYKEEQIVEGHKLLKPVIKAPYETRWSSRHAEELRSRSADIYATIQECRDSVGHKEAAAIKMKGYLLKKSK